MTRRNGATEIKRRERHAGGAGHTAGRWIERHRNSQALRDEWSCNCDGALSKPREALHRHGASVRPPFHRCSVSIRYLRPTPLSSSQDFMRRYDDSGSG